MEEEIDKKLADKVTKGGSLEGGDISLLAKERHPLELQETQDDERADTKKNQSAFYHKWDLIKKIMIVVFLWIATFLCTMAFSTVAPFFPIVVI